MRRTLVAVVALLAASSCSLGPREAWAEQIHGAGDEARDLRTARVRMSVGVEVIETNIRQEPQPLIERLEGVADFRSRLARMTSPGGAVVFYDDLVVYLPRSEAARQASPGGAWARFNFEREPRVDVDTNDRRLAVGAPMISPVLAVELLNGALTGSLERVGAMLYRARISQDAAVREITDEDRREGILRLFETLGVRDDLIPAEVWVDGEGLVRRIRLTLRQQKDRVNAFRMRLDFEYSGYGTAAELRPPSDAVERGRFRDFVVEFIRETG
jgi:hypothetical protein